MDYCAECKLRAPVLTMTLRSLKTGAWVDVDLCGRCQAERFMDRNGSVAAALKAIDAQAFLHFETHQPRGEV